jgi:hypothetical protein
MSSALRELIACPHTHTRKDYTDGVGTWIRGSAATFGVLVQGDGRAKYRARCEACGLVSTDIPVATLREWGGADLIEWSIERPGNDYEACSVLGCDSAGVEWHHFAPRNTFGSDADLWPVLPLCHGHHAEWHARMDGYKRNAKAAA